MILSDEFTTKDLVETLINREGVEWEVVKAGKEIAYMLPRDAYFIVVPPEAMPHKVTYKEKKETMAMGLMDYLAERTKDGDTEFARLKDGKDQKDVWPVLDELMTTLEMVHSRLYASVIAKLN